MPSLEQLSDDLWTGKTSTEDPDHHPFATLNQLDEVAPSVGFFKGFSNITAVKTEGDSVLIDTGSFHPVAHGRSFKGIRAWTDKRVAKAVYTHGHVDHAYGLPPFLAEAEDKGWDAPDIVAHCDVRGRMTRYIETAGYNEVINERQFGHAVTWPTDPIYPTTTYEDTLNFEVGGTTFELTHGRGETDDHTWVFLPEERVLCTGDFFIWAAPNAGNPQKVQRFIPEWRDALRAMASRKPKVLLPGHGLPVFGEERVQAALLDSADYLDAIYTQTLDMLNNGATIYDIIENVKPPQALTEKPYLQPVYDEPQFIARNIFRCLGGWYTGIPSELKPALRSRQAREIAELAGGIEKVLDRARKLLDTNDLPMACHLAEWAVEAAPDNRDAHRLRATIYRARRDAEPSTMSKGIFGAAVRESEGAARK